jgi:hypothetical protein
MGLRSFWRSSAALAITLIGLACSTADGRSGNTSSAAPSADQARLIDHLTPPRDSVGRAPDKFEWTKIEGADSYEIAVWNDIDILLWRQRRIPATHIDRPKELTFDAGTYMWSIAAFRGEEPIAESGRAAFVVRTDP